MICLGHPIPLPKLLVSVAWDGMSERAYMRHLPTGASHHYDPSATVPRPPTPPLRARADRRNRSYFLSGAILSHLFSAECEEEEENMERRADGQENPFSSERGWKSAAANAACSGVIRGGDYTLIGLSVDVLTLVLLSTLVLCLVECDQRKMNCPPPPSSSARRRASS